MRDWSPVLGLPLWVWLFVVPSLVAALCWWMGPRAARVLGPLWRVLDGLYLASGAVAACFMVTILGLIVVGMIARWVGVALPGTTEFAGYAMAATSFFALAHAMTRAAHIRVSILRNASRFLNRWLDVFAVFGAAIIATYFARYSVKTNVFSEMLNDRTQGQDQIPEWVVTWLSLPSMAPGAWGAATSEASSDLVYAPRLGATIGNVHRNDPFGHCALGYALPDAGHPSQPDQGRGGGMTEAYATVVFLFVLFALLGSSIWFGLALMGGSHGSGWSCLPPAPRAMP